MTDPETVKFGQIQLLVTDFGSQSTTRSEFQTIFDCFGDTTVLDFDVILRLASFAEPLAAFLDVCGDNAREIACHGDSQFRNLCSFANDLKGDAMGDFTISECKLRERNIVIVLTGKAGNITDALINLFHIFVLLESSREVWNLVQEKEWYGEGLETFRGEYDNVTNINQDDSFSSDVLNSLGTAVRYISKVFDHKANPTIAGFVKAVIDSPEIVAGVATLFIELQNVQKYIVDISRLFSGEGSVVGV
jgi:hypothetical protein